MTAKNLRNSLFMRLMVQSIYIYQQRFIAFYLISSIPIVIGLLVNKYYIENDILVSNLIQFFSFEIFYIIDFFVNFFLAMTVIIYFSALIKYMHSCSGEKLYGVFSAYKAAIKNIKDLFLVLILYAGHILIWSLLLIIPGIFAGINLSLAPMLVLLEGKKGKDALNASKAYVKRNFNRYLDPLFIMFCLVGLFCSTILFILEHLKIILYYDLNINVIFLINGIEWFVVFNCICFFLTFYYLLYLKIKEAV